MPGPRTAVCLTPCLPDHFTKGTNVARPVTLFTGQWADLPLETLAEKASEWG